MSHELRDEDLSAYLDGELDESRRGQIELHLEACPRCRETLSAYRIDSARLRATKEELLAESFVYSVRARIRSGSDEQVSWIPAERSARRLVLGLALVVIAVTGFFWNTTEPVTGVLERYYSTQQDSVINSLLNAETTPSKDDLLMAVMTK